MLVDLCSNCIGWEADKYSLSKHSCSSTFSNVHLVIETNWLFRNAPTSWAFIKQLTRLSICQLIHQKFLAYWSTAEQQIIHSLETPTLRRYTKVIQDRANPRCNKPTNLRRICSKQLHRIWQLQQCHTARHNTPTNNSYILSHLTMVVVGLEVVAYNTYINK